MTLREATTPDLERICVINRAAIEALDDGPYDERQRSAWRDAVEPERYPVSDERARVFVAETDDTVVGFGWLELAPATT